MSEKKYTAEDFAKAQAATLNRTRGLGGRVDHGDSLPWLILSEDDRRWVRDEDMAAGGWVPVPSSPAKPTITAGEVGRRSHLVRGGNVETPSLVDFLEALGIEVVPDPVPSNAERLAALMYEADEKDHSSVPGGWEHVAEFLDRAGVTVPGGEE